MYKSPIELLRHIYDECEFIERVITSEMTKDDLIDNEILKRAVTRSLEIIGEATKSIPVEVKPIWAEVPWKNIAGMRDKLIHDYIGLNYTIVWDVVKNKIPEVKVVILQIIEKELNK
jgi:uncharacterized protein with HEPN domain